MKPDDVLGFWFGTLDADGLADSEHSQRWWRKDTAFDAEIRSNYQSLWREIQAGAHEHWLEEPRSRLAYVVVLDQFSRNMFRGQAAAFAGDPAALRAAADGVARGHDRSLIGHERVFVYMPFMHSEELAMQERCVELFAAMCHEAPEKQREMLASNASYAERHRDVIARWGRFPHRNQALGRTSTAEELEFLTQPGSSF